MEILNGAQGIILANTIYMYTYIYIYIQIGEGRNGVLLPCHTGQTEFLSTGELLNKFLRANQMRLLYRITWYRVGRLAFVFVHHGE